MLARLGLSIDLNVQLSQNASAIIALVEALPYATFILDHIGNAPVLGNASAVALWQAQLSALSAFPNVICKISGILQEFKSGGVFPSEASVQPWVVAAISAFSFQRSMFAGNWFFVDWLNPPNLAAYSSWASFITTAVGTMNATQADLDNLFYKTGAFAYRVQA